MESITFFICLLVPLSIVGAEDYIQLYSDWSGVSKENITNCLEETNFPYEDLVAALTFRLGDLGDPENKEIMTRYGCFLSCFYHKTGAMVDKKFLPEVFAATVTRKTHNNAPMRAYILKVMYRCAQRIKRIEDPCEVAQAFTTCFWIGTAGEFDDNVAETARNV